MRRGPVRVALAASLLVMLSLVLAMGVVESPRHDEGTTFDVAVGWIWPDPWPGDPVPVSELYSIVGGESDYATDDVFHALGVLGRIHHPPAYYLLIHWWSRLVGTDPHVLRLPAYVFAVLTVLGIVALSRRLVPEANGGYWVALLLAVSPWFIAITHYLRPYGLALTVAVWSSVAAYEIVARGARSLRWRLGFIGLSILGIYTLYHYVFVILWQLAFLLAGALLSEPGRRLRQAGAVVASAAAVVVAFAPWRDHLEVHLQWATRGNDYWVGAVPPADWLDRLGDLLRMFAVTELDVVTPVEWGLVAIGVVTLVLAVRSFAGGRAAAFSPAVRLFWCCAPLLPVAMLSADAWLGMNTFFVPKLAFAMFPLLVLLVMRGWSTLPRPGWRTAGLAAWAILLTCASACNLHTIDRRVSDHESVAAYARGTDSPDHTLVVSSRNRGHVSALVLALRDASVEHVNVLYAPQHRVVHYMREVAEDPDAGRVTFVNLSLPYLKTETWDKDLLMRAREIARENGWWGRWVGPNGAPELKIPSQRAMAIISPVRLPR